MSFAERQLRLTFSGVSVGGLSVAGLRAYASIQAVSGKLGVSAQVRVWGLTLAQMNAYSSKISAGVGIEQFNLVVEAGDVGSQLSQVVNGTIWRSYPDFQDAPESAFNVTVAGTIYQSAIGIAAQSQRGARNAEDAIASICAAAGLKFHNNDAHAVLRNHSTYGSAIDQILDVARAARFQVYLEGNDVWIYPGNGIRDDVVIVTGPDDGMTGYPEWTEIGLLVRTLFNPEIQVGRQMKVKSSIPKANGMWSIYTVQHDLATMLDRGPWFTTALLSTGGWFG